MVSIAGRIAHETSAGDGVRAFICHSQLGQLRTATVHNSAEEMRVASSVGLSIRNVRIYSNVA